MAAGLRAARCVKPIRGAQTDERAAPVTLRPRRERTRVAGVRRWDESSDATYDTSFASGDPARATDFWHPTRSTSAEGGALPRVLQGAAPDALGLPTLCDRWSVRDVVAHCGEALESFARGADRTFSPEENQGEVDRRSTWPFELVVDEFTGSCGPAAEAVDQAGGAADGVGLGVWIRGGDVRHALQHGDAFTSEGIELAIALISARSIAKSAPRLHVVVDGAETPFGIGAQQGHLIVDAASFVRLIAGRPLDPATYELSGLHPRQLDLFP